MNYRHAFHAGNFADVVKHVLLIGLIRALQRKDKPFRVFDTHAGAGRYSLDSAAADRNREYQNGIGRLWNRASRIPELEAYCNQVRAFNPDGVLREYPGSPCLIRQLLRPGDRLTLTELHEIEAALCKSLIALFHSRIKYPDVEPELRAA